MHFDAGVVLIKSTVCGFSMRKTIALVLLLALGTMPLQTSAQVSVPAVDLQCVRDGPSEGPLILINLSGNVLNDTAICTVTNPNTYAERIQIGVSADGLVADAPGTISLGPKSGPWDPILGETMTNSNRPQFAVRTVGPGTVWLKSRHPRSLC